MPFINISLAGMTLTDTQKQHLFDETTRLMSEVMNKNPNLTSVRIDEHPSTNWAVAKKSMAFRGETAVHMDIMVTNGTNTDEEKAEMIKQSMLMLKQVTCNTPEASYIVIHNLDSSAWGYDGKTQKARTEQTIPA